MASNRGLGRGLSSLLGETIAGSDDSDELRHLSVEELKTGPYQPRKRFDTDSLYELAESIKKNGLIQPIIVALVEGDYTIIAGERRWRAAKIAGLVNIPVIVKDIDSKTMLEYALVENIQRQDLNVIEESEAYLQLMGEFGYTQEELANVVGKSRSHVANLLRLNSLPQTIKQQLINGDLSMGHARALIGNPNAEAIAETIIAKGLNVRQAEAIAKSWEQRNSHREGVIERTSRSQGSDDKDLNDLVSALSEKFGMKVTIERVGLGGKVIFHYQSLEQLDAVLIKLT